MNDHTAGTAGRGYRCEPEPHAFQVDDRSDYGRRATCLTCGGERWEHLPTPRASLEQPVRRAS